jgi:hypothetical protein
MTAFPNLTWALWQLAKLALIAGAVFGEFVALSLLAPERMPL